MNSRRTIAFHTHFSPPQSALFALAAVPHASTDRDWQFRGIAPIFVQRKNCKPCEEGRERILGTARTLITALTANSRGEEERAGTAGRGKVEPRCTEGPPDGCSNKGLEKNGLIILGYWDKVGKDGEDHLVLEGCQGL